MVRKAAENSPLNPSDIDPEGQYQVTLKAPIRVAGQQIRPDSNGIVLKGSLLSQVIDSVETYAPTARHG